MSLLLAALALAQTGPQKTPQPGPWEVRYTDGSAMKVILLDDQIGLVTPYGSLQIPLRDVRRIEVGVRLEPSEQKALDAALADVASGNAGRRAAGQEALIALGGKALPAIRKADKKADEEARAALADVAARLQAALPDPKAEVRDDDVVTTDDSRFAGRVQSPALRINTFQFGELKLRLADASSLQQGGGKEEVKYELVEGRRVLDLFATHMGKVVGLRVTGAVQGTVWGSGPFTGDSDLATAAVFAGALKVGETGIVKVRLVPSPPTYLGGNANGVVANPFGFFPTGGYEIVK